MEASDKITYEEGQSVTMYYIALAIAQYPK
jgi:hypothetical protein